MNGCLLCIITVLLSNIAMEDCTVQVIILKWEIMSLYDEPYSSVFQRQGITTLKVMNEN